MELRCLYVSFHISFLRTLKPTAPAVQVACLWGFPAKAVEVVVALFERMPSSIVVVRPVEALVLGCRVIRSLGFCSIVGESDTWHGRSEADGIDIGIGIGFG